MTRATDRRTPRQMSYWLWMLVVGMTSALGAFAIANAFLPADRAVTRDQLGQDFIAFYSAGRLVGSGQFSDLYDLGALATVQHAIAAQSGATLASDVAPWLNPPFAAWLFAPLSSISLGDALACWTVFNVACLAAAAWLLTNLIRETSERRRDWLLVPALLAIAPPAIQSLGHGQNTCLSLLMMTACVLAWRARRPLLGGLAWSLLCYKPQLAAVVGLAMFATLGWRFLVGAMLGLVPLLLVTLDLMPGSLADYAIRMPANLAEFQRTHPPLWHRHVTVLGLLQSLLPHAAPAALSSAFRIVSYLGVAAVLLLLGRAWWQFRTRPIEDEAVLELSLDRFIALALLATPLASSYFVDYDLLVLAIAGVLIGREMMLARDASIAARTMRIVGPITFVWLAINPPLAETTGINLTVPLLITLVALQSRRCSRSPEIAEIGSLQSPPIAAEASSRLAA